MSMKVEATPEVLEACAKAAELVRGLSVVDGAFVAAFVLKAILMHMDGAEARAILMDTVVSFLNTPVSEMTDVGSSTLH